MAPPSNDSQEIVMDTEEDVEEVASPNEGSVLFPNDARPEMKINNINVTQGRPGSEYTFNCWLVNLLSVRQS